MKRIRIYGKRLNTWTAINEKGREVATQIELAYKEYNEDGELVGTGSEDFSMERYNAEIQRVWICTWDGQKRNKGGYRWFDNCGSVEIRKADRKEVKKHYEEKYNAAEVQLR